MLFATVKLEFAWQTTVPVLVIGSPEYPLLIMLLRKTQLSNLGLLLFENITVRPLWPAKIQLTKTGELLVWQLTVLPYPVGLLFKKMQLLIIGVPLVQDIEEAALGCPLPTLLFLKTQLVICGEPAKFKLAFSKIIPLNCVYVETPPGNIP